MPENHLVQPLDTIPSYHAHVYFDGSDQHRSAWSREIEVRPWVEKF